MRILILLLAISCSLAPSQKTSLKERLKNAGYSLTTGCKILSTHGVVIRSYPGTMCYFEDDGSILSYDSKKIELTKFDRLLKVIWSKKLHVHHEIKKTSSGNYLLNSSSFKSSRKGRMRFDDVLLLSPSGEILKTFHFHSALLENQKIDNLDYLDAFWDETLGSFIEATHLAASYEIPFDIAQGNKKLYPKSSIIVSFTFPIPGVVIIDPEFKKILGRHRLTHRELVHDAQFVSSSDILFFKNTTYAQPISVSEQASVKFFDVFKNRIDEEITLDLYGIYTGGVQLVEDDILLISDSNAGQLITHESFKDVDQNSYIVKNQIHASQKGRLVFYDRKTKLTEQLHFDFNFQHVKAQKLNDFLKLNIGI